MWILVPRSNDSCEIDLRWIDVRYGQPLERPEIGVDLLGELYR